MEPGDLRGEGPGQWSLLFISSCPPSKPHTRAQIILSFRCQRCFGRGGCGTRQCVEVHVFCFLGDCPTGTGFPVSFFHEVLASLVCLPMSVRGWLTILEHPASCAWLLETHTPLRHAVSHARYTGLSPSQGVIRPLHRGLHHRASSARYTGVSITGRGPPATLWCLHHRA